MASNARALLEVNRSLHEPCSLADRVISGGWKLSEKSRIFEARVLQKSRKYASITFLFPGRSFLIPMDFAYKNIAFKLRMC